jgi:hypothetical protein
MCALKLKKTKPQDLTVSALCVGIVLLSIVCLLIAMWVLIIVTRLLVG